MTSIRNIIVHEVLKDEGALQFKLFPREIENDHNDHAQNLIDQLTGLFRKTGLSTGKFVTPETEDHPKPHFVKVLENHFNATSFDDFVVFSKAATDHFIYELNRSSSSIGGYLWFNHYVHNDENFLSVVLLRKKHGLALSSDLTLDAIEQLDLDKLHMAARINLSAWKKGDSSKYIAFRIGRDAKDVTDYFSNFIGCEEFTRARVDTMNLIQVTNKYCESHHFSDEKTEQAKQFVYDQCLSWLDNNDPVLLENISNLLDNSFANQSQNLHGRFLEIAQNDPFFLNNEITIEKSALKGLTRYQGRNKGMFISFNSDLLNKKVFYDSSTGELKFLEIPNNLKAQLNNN